MNLLENLILCFFYKYWNANWSNRSLYYLKLGGKKHRREYPVDFNRGLRNIQIKLTIKWRTNILECFSVSFFPDFNTTAENQLHSWLRSIIKTINCITIASTTHPHMYLHFVYSSLETNFEKCMTRRYDRLFWKLRNNISLTTYKFCCETITLWFWVRK